MPSVEHPPLSLYVHVPFCRSRCGYCDFNTYTAQELGGMSTNVYLEAALRELEMARERVGDRQIQTVFFGGGTPTMLPAAQLAGILDEARRLFRFAPDAEVTTEANPETVDQGYFEHLRNAGFTRISLGMQSVSAHVLKVLERAHTPRRGLDAARWAAEAGFEHVSLDLIYGTPGESHDDWRRSLEAVTSAPVDHVSAYSLIVEHGTRLGLQVRKGLVAMPDDDDLADKYVIADDYLTGLGFANYEVSNWAQPSGECRHNLAYWHGADWWGIGPGAHGHIDGVRFWNRKHPRPYSEAIMAGELPIQGSETLTDDERHLERILLELRLATGLRLDVLTPSERERVPGFVEQGLAELVGDRLVLNQRGRLLADGIIRDLLD